MMKNCVFKPSVDTQKWFKKTAIRCVRTFAATVVSLLPTTAATLGSVNWQITYNRGKTGALRRSRLYH